MADNVTGIVLDIPASVLQNIKNADKAIKDLEQTSKKAAQSIKRDFDATMVSGVEAFIKKVQEAQSKLGNLKMPTSAMNLGNMSQGAVKSASDISSLVQSLSQLTAALEKNKSVRAASKNVASQETDYARVSAELAKQAERYTQLSLAIEQFNQKKRDETSFRERQQNTSNIQELQALQQTIPLLRQKVELMERNMRAAQTANNPTLQTRRAQEELAAMNKMYAEEEKASAKKAAQLEKDRQREAAAAQKAHEQQQKLYDKLFGKGGVQDRQIQQSLAQQRAATLASPTGAMDYAKNARSLRDLQAAYKNLKAVMASTDPKSSSWQQMNAVLAQTRTRIDEIKKKMGEFKSTTQGVGDIAGQMKRTLAAVFSVSAITGYINKMIEVRAQFELQQTALRAILQDKQKADQIFQQVQQMALQSPFSIMQMTTFTKQLAAYRIEADKLVGTTKMLADVSAGLGVDMQRLILAYGQVKAANYLRATEVRQFTEAGLNIAGELAKYFSELQGKMISVGDVMEMITKRMVRFEDVEEVFKRVTSAGGLFYDMQKKQSETLWGQLQRIKDAISIMFNEIGKDNQGAISNILNLVRSLINHWRMLAPIISTVGAAMATVLAVKGIQAFITSLRTMGAAVATLALKWRGVAAEAAAAAVAERGATMATGIGVAVTVVTALTGALLGAWQEAHALNEEFDRISEESSKDMWDLIYKYRDLAESVKDTSKTYSEHQKALENLQNTFKGILPDYMLEEDYLRKITDGYNEATEALQVYSAEKARQEAQEAINTEKNKMWEDFMNTAKDSYVVFQEAIPDLKNASKAAVRGIIGNIILQIREEYEKGMIKTAEDGYNRFMEITQEKFSSFNPSKAKHEFEVVFTSNAFDTNFQDILDFASEKNEEFARQYEKNVGVKDEADRKHYQHWVDQHEQMSKQLDVLYAKMQAVADLKSKGLYYGESSNPDETRGVTDKGAAATDELAKQFSLVNKLRENLGLIPMDWRNITEATNTSTSVLSTFSNIQEEVIGGFKRFVAEHTKSNAVLGWINNLTSGYTTLSAQQQDMIAKSAQIIKMHGLEASVIDKLHITAETNYAAAAQAAKALSDEADANIQKIMATANELINLGRASNIAISMSSAIAKAESMWGMFISKLKGEKEAGLDIAKLFGYTDKVPSAAPKVPKTPRTRGQGQDKELNRWKNIKKAIEDTNKSYEEFRKNYSAEESNKMIEDQYGEIFKELGVDIKTFYKNGKYDAAQLVEALKVLKNMTNQNTEARKNFTNELSRDIKEVEVDIKMKLREDDIKKFKQGLDDIFNNYELSKTFADLGVNINVVYALGGKPTKLSDIRAQLDELKNKIGGKDGAEEQYKAIEDAEKRLAKMEQKYAEERAKNYIKYLTESLAERAQIEIKAQQDINKIREDATLDAFSKEQAINNRRKQMNEDLAKFDFDNFKASDVYISVFEDLEHASKTQLQYVIGKLRELQSTYKDLSPTQVKAIAKSINDAEKALGNKSIFLNFKAVFEYQRQRNALKAQQVALQEQILLLEGQEAEQAKKLYDAELALKSIKDTNSDEYKTQSKEVEGQRVNLTAIQGGLRRAHVILQRITGQIQKGEDDTDGLLQTWNEFAKTLQAISSALSDVQEGLENMGSGSAAMSDGISTAQEVIGGVMSAGEGVLQAYTDPSPWGKMQGAVKAVGGAIKTVGALFAIGDKKKERQIQRLQEKIERLQTAYEKLEKAMEDAYTFDKYNADYEKAMQNLLAQRKAVQEQLALEESKKKSDKNKIKEYEKTLDELIEKEKELRESRYEAMGSVGNSGILSEAENFVSAWLDAYKETGDGLDALGDHWDEFFENLVLKQASSAVVSRRMKKYIDQINAAIDSGDTGLSLSQTFAQIGQNLKNELGEWNEDLKTFFDAVGIKGSQGELLLSDLQKGIQNITEPQAAAIEAYLNSMRFAVFEQNNILTNMLTAIQAQYGANDNNTMLNEVKAIRTLVGSIDDRLSRVIISRNSSNSGYIMKVG